MGPDYGEGSDLNGVVSGRRNQSSTEGIDDVVSEECCDGG